MKLVLASNNAGKLGELQALLAPLGVTLIAQGDLNVPEAPEPHRTFVENALAKARNAAHHTGLAAIADDAGLCVEAFGGLPEPNASSIDGFLFGLAPSGVCTDSDKSELQKDPCYY